MNVTGTSMARFSTEFDPNVPLMPPGKKLTKPDPAGILFQNDMLFRPQGIAYVCRNWCVPSLGAEIREVCAYQLSQAMGFDYVSTIVWRQHGSQRGSLRKWIPDSFKQWDRKKQIPNLNQVGYTSAVELWLLEAVLMAVDSVHTNYLWCAERQQILRIDMCECLPTPEAVAGRLETVKTGEYMRAHKRGDYPQGWNWPLLWNWPQLHLQPIHDEALNRLASVPWQTLKAQWVSLGLDATAADMAEQRARKILDLKIIDTEAVWGLPNPYPDLPSLDARP